MWSFKAEANLCRFFLIVRLYMYCRWRSSYQERRVGHLINQFTPDTLFVYFCLSQDKTWITNVICRGLLVYSEAESWSIVLLILVELITITV